MAIRYISKGKGKKRRVIPIGSKKKGVTVRSVSLRPNAVIKVNKEQIRLLNKGQPATFSKALNQVVMRAKRAGIPIYDTHVNLNERRKPFMMWIVKHPEKGDKIKGSETIVMADNYGQAIDDFITTWNKEKRMKTTIGYPQVQGTADKSFRYRKDDRKIIKEMFGAQQSKGDRLIDKIRHGDKVTIITNHGQKLTGRAVMKSSAGDNSWVLNTGGAHGTPALAFDDNVIKVVKG